MTIAKMLKIIHAKQMSIVPVVPVEKSKASFIKGRKPGFVIRDDPTGEYLSPVDLDNLSSEYTWVRLTMDAKRFDKKYDACEYALKYLEAVKGIVE